MLHAWFCNTVNIGGRATDLPKGLDRRQRALQKRKKRGSRKPGDSDNRGIHGHLSNAAKSLLIDDYIEVYSIIQAFGTSFGLPRRVPCKRCMKAAYPAAQ